jgi:hypothetical protein
VCVERYTRVLMKASLEFPIHFRKIYSDLDVLLILKNEAVCFKRQLRRVGYELATTSDAVPSILAYTEDEWESREKSGSPFWQAVERDAVSVL